MSSDDDEASVAVTPEVARVKRKLKATQDELELLKGNKKPKNMYVPLTFLLACRHKGLVVWPARTQH